MHATARRPSRDVIHEPVLHALDRSNAHTLGRTIAHLSPNELVEALHSGVPPWSPGEPTVVVVPADEDWPDRDDRITPASGVIVGLSEAGQTHPTEARGAAWCDVVLSGADDVLDRIVDRVESTPIASSAVVQLLRRAEGRSMEDGLLVESAVYSTLQSGPEFRRWRESRPRRERPNPHQPAVLVSRDGEHVSIVLNRPHVRNALDSALRDGLVDAFHLVALDDSIHSVTLSGAGKDFSSGGDLDEFGSFSDPASAHLIRLTASVGWAIATVAARVTAQLHGACMGSGIELPAFAGKVIADTSTRIALPELALGLIPGAGGTWSITQRIGRHRTALLALTGDIIDAPTALAWELIDEIGDHDRH